MHTHHDWRLGTIVHPDCYEDLRQLTRQQLKAKVLELDDRARNVQRFLDQLDSAESPDEITALAHATGADYYEDHLVEGIEKIIREWPWIKSAPGAGYW